MPPQTKHARPAQSNSTGSVNPVEARAPPLVVVAPSTLEVGLGVLLVVDPSTEGDTDGLGLGFTDSLGDTDGLGDGLTDGLGLTLTLGLGEGVEPDLQPVCAGFVRPTPWLRSHSYPAL